MTWRAWAQHELDAVRKQERWREAVVFDAHGVRGHVQGREVVCFASNDYLGLSQHPHVRAAAHAAIDRFGTGATASRLVVGTRSVHEALEHSIGRWKHCEAALVFPTGYAANLAVLSTFGASGVHVFSDELNHASIIDGCRLARANVQIYRHGDLDHLESLLRSTPSRSIVVTETVFSMDGDTAPLAQLDALCSQYDALLILDEAHAVLGPDVPCFKSEVVRVGTLSKALGSQGGWVAGSRELVMLLVNRARSFIFTTGLSPADAAAALAALEIVCGAEGSHLRAQLRRHIAALAPSRETPIVPVILGDDAAALQVAAELLECGLYVPAIRPPTVPRGTARLRIILSARHAPADVKILCEALDTILARRGMGA